MMFKRDQYVRFISIQDMSTPIRTDYETLVEFLDSKIYLLLRKYHKTASLPLHSCLQKNLWIYVKN